MDGRPEEKAVVLLINRTVWMRPDDILKLYSAKISWCGSVWDRKNEQMTEKTLDIKALSVEVRADFPGHSGAPARTFYVRKAQPYEKGAKVAVTGILHNISPLDANNPDEGNADDYCSFEHVWGKDAKTGSWQLVYAKELSTKDWDGAVKATSEWDAKAVVSGRE